MAGSMVVTLVMTLVFGLAAVAIACVISAVFLIWGTRIVVKERLGFGEAYVTALIAGLINFAISFVVSTIILAGVADPLLLVGIQVVQSVVSLAIYSIVIEMRHGFGFWRSVLIVLVMVAIVFVITMVVFAVLFGAMALMGP